MIRITKYDDESQSANERSFVSGKSINNIAKLPPLPEIMLAEKFFPTKVEKNVMETIKMFRRKSNQFLSNFSEMFRLIICIITIDQSDIEIPEIAQQDDHVQVQLVANNFKIIISGFNLEEMGDKQKRKQRLQKQIENIQKAIMGTESNKFITDITVINCKVDVFHILNMLSKKVQGFKDKLSIKILGCSKSVLNIMKLKRFIYGQRRDIRLIELNQVQLHTEDTLENLYSGNFIISYMRQKLILSREQAVRILFLEDYLKPQILPQINQINISLQPLFPLKIMDQQSQKWEQTKYDNSLLDLEEELMAHILMRNNLIYLFEIARGYTIDENTFNSKKGLQYSLDTLSYNEETIQEVTFINLYKPNLSIFKLVIGKLRNLKLKSLCFVNVPLLIDHLIIVKNLLWWNKDHLQQIVFGGNHMNETEFSFLFLSTNLDVTDFKQLKSIQVFDNEYVTKSPSYLKIMKQHEGIIKGKSEELMEKNKKKLEKNAKKQKKEEEKIHKELEKKQKQEQKKLEEEKKKSEKKEKIKDKKSLQNEDSMPQIPEENTQPYNNLTQMNNLVTQINVTQMDEQDQLKDKSAIKLNKSILKLTESHSEFADRQKYDSLTKKIESQAIIDYEDVLSYQKKNQQSISIMNKLEPNKNEAELTKKVTSGTLKATEESPTKKSQQVLETLTNNANPTDQSASMCNIKDDQEGDVNSIVITEKIKKADKYKKEDFTMRKKMINSLDFRTKVKDNDNLVVYNKVQKLQELDRIKKEQTMKDNMNLGQKTKVGTKKTLKKIQFEGDLNKEPKTSLLNEIKRKISKQEARRKSKQFYQFQTVDKLRGEVQNFYQIDCDEVFRAENEDSITAIIKNHYLQKDYNLKLDLSRVNIKKCSEHTERYLIEYISQSKRLEEVILVQYTENFAYNLSVKIKEFDKTFEVFEISFKPTPDSTITIQQEYFCYLIESVLSASRRVVIKNLDIKDNQLIIELNEILRKLEEDHGQCCIELDGLQINESFISQDLVVQMFTSFMRSNFRKKLSWKNVIRNSWMAIAIDEALHNDNSQMGFEKIILDGNIMTDQFLYTLLRRNSETLQELRLINISGSEGVPLFTSTLDAMTQNSKQKETKDSIFQMNNQDNSPNNGSGEDSNSNHNIYGNQSDERRKKRRLFTEFHAIFGYTCSILLEDQELSLKQLKILDLSGSVQQNYITFICAILVKSSEICELYLKGSETGKYSVLRQNDMEYLAELLYEMRLLKRNQLQVVDISYNTDVEQAITISTNNFDNNNMALSHFIEALLKTQESSLTKLFIKGRNEEGSNMITDKNVGNFAKAFSKKRVRNLKEIDISYNSLQFKKSFQELNILLQNIFESAPSLKYLKMVGKEKESMINDIVADGISKVLDMGIAPEIHSLDFSQNLAIPTTSFKNLVLSLVTNCSKLNYLNLAGSSSHVMLTNEKAEELINILEDNVDLIQNIREIDLSRNVALSARVLGRLMSCIFINCNHLEILRLRGYESFSMIESEKAKALALAMQSLSQKNTNSLSSNLTTLNFSQMMASQKNKNTTLAVANNQLGFGGSSSYFKLLDISLNDIDAGPLNTLFKGLLENQSLKVKQINKSRLNDLGRLRTLQQKQYQIQNEDDFTDQNLISFYEILNHFGGKIFPSLQEVIITEIALINPNVLENFTKTIFAASFQSLKKLGLVGSPKMQVLDDERVEMLSQIFDEYHHNLLVLEEVDISQNSINTSPLHLLLESVFQCQSVKRLKVCGSEQYSMINNQRAKALIEFFDCQRNIQLVDLSYNVIDDLETVYQLFQNIVYNNFETLQQFDIFYPNSQVSQIYIDTLTQIFSKLDYNQVQTEITKQLSNPQITSTSPKSKRRYQQYNNLSINPSGNAGFGQFLESPVSAGHKNIFQDISPTIVPQNTIPHFVSPTNKKQLSSKFKNEFETKPQKRGSMQTEYVGLNHQNKSLPKQNSLNSSPVATSTTGVTDRKLFQLNVLKIDGSQNSNGNSNTTSNVSDDPNQKQINTINHQNSQGQENQNQQSGTKPNRKQSDEVSNILVKQENLTEQDKQGQILFTTGTIKEQEVLPPQPELQKQPSSAIASFFSNILNLNSNNNSKPNELENSANKLTLFQEIGLFVQGCRQDKIEAFRKILKKCSKMQIRININYKLSCILPNLQKNPTTPSNTTNQNIQTNVNYSNFNDPATLQTLSDTFYLDKITISQLDLSSSIEKIYWFMQNKKTLIVKREALEEMPLLAYCFSFNKNFKSFKLDSLFADSGMSTLFVNELFLKTCRSVLPIKPDSAYLHSVVLNANFFKILEFTPNQLEHIIFPSSSLNPGFECIKDGTFILAIQSYCQHIMSLKTIQLEYEFNQEDPSYYYLNEKELLQKLLIMPPTIIRTKPKSNLNFLKALYSILYDSYYFESCEIDYNEASALNTGIAVSWIERAYQMNPSRKISRLSFMIKRFFYFFLDLIISKETIFQLDQQVLYLNNEIVSKKIYGIGFKEILIILNIIQIFAQISPVLFSNLDDPNGKISPIAYFIFAGFGGLSFIIELLLYLDILRYVSHLIPGLYVTKSKGIINKISNSTKKFLMNIKMFNYKIVKCGVQLFQSLVARYDTFSDLSFIVACFQRKYLLLAYISVGVVVFNLLINYIYFLFYLIRKRKVKRNLNTDNIIQYYKIAALTECSALSEVLDSICPYNVKHLPDWCIFRGWRNQSINSHILNYMQKFLLKNLPQIVLQTLYLLKSAGTELNYTVIISMTTSIVSFCLSFITFLTIRPSAITQIDFNELAAKKQIELVQKYKQEEYIANSQFKQIFPSYYAQANTNLVHAYSHTVNTMQNNNINPSKTERGSVFNTIIQSHKNSLKNVKSMKPSQTLLQQSLMSKKTNIQMSFTPSHQNNNSTFQNLRTQKNSILVELSRVNNKSALEEI